MTGDVDEFDPHRVRSHPKPTLAIQSLIDDERLLGLGMMGNTEHTVGVAFVVTIDAGARFSRNSGHGEASEERIPQQCKCALSMA